MTNTFRHFEILVALMMTGLVTACGGGGGGSSSSAPAAASVVTTQEVQTSSYVVTLFGESGQDTFAVALNESGEVVGNALQSDGTQDVVLWSGGDLATLVEEAVARDINDDGDVVGWLGTGSAAQAFVHAGSLEVFDFPEGASRAYGIDNAGQVVGRYTADIEQTFVYGSAGTETPLPSLDGYATGINDAGQILIKSVGEGRIGALLLENNGSLIDLGSLGGVNSQPQDINVAGEIVGWSQSADGTYRAFHWKDGIMSDLSRPEWTYSSAVAINDSGQVLIKASTGTENRVYLWDDGTLTDLDYLGLEYAEVTDMNDRGQIVGWTTGEQGNFLAFLATPRS